jgi:predicted acylesterase/phospholipase RssA
MAKIALVLSGAVSLGTFEAGVLTELLYVLDRRARDGTRHEIDVITGASAGSMTAALTARAVLHGYENRAALRQAWVEEIDIKHLLRTIPVNALLSKDPIESIADRFLRVDANTPVAPPLFAPDELRLVFTLSNMNGIDYALNPGDDPVFVSTFHSDRRVFRVASTSSTDADQWTRIRESAIASGNFPLAFQPAKLPSDSTQAPGHAHEKFPDFFTYVDGGYFNNEPIREAVLQARELDGNTLDPERVFILVDANLNGSKYDETFGPEASLLGTVHRLFGILRAEAAANDWLKSRRLDTQIAWRDALLDSLVDIVQTNVIAEPAAFRAQLQGAAQKIVDAKTALFGSDRYGPDYLTKALDRTRTAHLAAYPALVPGQLEILDLLTFLLNSVAGLDKKAPLRVSVICTKPEETAGDQLFAFGGFFNRDWRQHDFAVGRRTARELLPAILGYEPSAVPREPDGEYEIPLDLSKVTMRSADRASREALRDAVVDKAQDLLKEHAPGASWLKWATRPLVSWVGGSMLKKKVESFLELR